MGTDGSPIYSGILWSIGTKQLVDPDLTDVTNVQTVESALERIRQTGIRVIAMLVTSVLLDDFMKLVNDIGLLKEGYVFLTAVNLLPGTVNTSDPNLQNIIGAMPRTPQGTEYVTQFENLYAEAITRTMETCRVFQVTMYPERVHQPMMHAIVKAAYVFRADLITLIDPRQRRIDVPDGLLPLLLISNY